MRLNPSVFEDGESFNGSPIGFCFVVLLKIKHNLFSKTPWIHFHTLLLLIRLVPRHLLRWRRQVSTAAIVKKVGISPRRRRCDIASLRERGGPRSGGKSLRMSVISNESQNFSELHTYDFSFTRSRGSFLPEEAFRLSLPLWKN